jgi:hypothetical protein
VTHSCKEEAGDGVLAELNDVKDKIVGEFRNVERRRRKIRAFLASDVDSS